MKKLGFSNAGPLIMNDYSEFIGTLKGSDSGKIYDVSMFFANGNLTAKFTEVGNDSSFLMAIERHRFSGKATKSGGRYPNYVGNYGDASLAIWRDQGNEYRQPDDSRVFAVFTDVNERRKEAGKSILDAVDDAADEKRELARTIWEQADGMSGRPDKSRDAELEMLEECQRLNG